MHTLEKLMNSSIKSIRHDATVRETATLMRDEGVGSLLVHHEGRIIGIVTETDIVRKVVATGLDLNKEKVASIMTAPVIAIEMQRTPQDAHDMMADLAVRHLAISDKGKIVGIISVRDLLVYFKRISEPRITQD